MHQLTFDCHKYGIVLKYDSNIEISIPDTHDAGVVKIAADYADPLVRESQANYTFHTLLKSLNFLERQPQPSNWPKSIEYQC
jgi:hypothetical protein